MKFEEAALPKEWEGSNGKESNEMILTALNFYARGSYQGSVGQNMDGPMAQQTVSRCLKEVTNALNAPHILRKFIRFPQNRHERNIIKQRFFDRYEIPGVIGCIDCTHIAIVRPAHGEDQYFNRKHFHSINTQVDEQEVGEAASSAALGAILEAGDGDDDEPERRLARLGGQLARLDALNVAGMLAAATDGGGAALAARLDAGLAAAAALAARHARYEGLARGATDASHARSGAARADHNARALLQDLHDTFEWLDAPPLRDLDALPEVPLTTPEGRARALAACHALRAALRAEPGMPPHRRRLAAVRERVRRLARARDSLAQAVARHVNNLLIHLGNEAAAGGAGSAARHRAELLPLAPFMLCLKDMDERAFDALARTYTSTWARVYEREVRTACDAARATLAAEPARADDALDSVLALVETLCDAEQEFCTDFFHLDVDARAEAERGESASGGEAEGERRGGAESRRFMALVFPALDAALVGVVQAVERHAPHGAFRALAGVTRRALGRGGDARWARAALAGAAVAAKRRADRVVAERAAALGDAVRAAARRPKCGVLPFIVEFEELSAACEAIFAGGRRADLERWYLTLGTAMLAAVGRAEHPRTPRAVVLMENCHRLGGALAALRVPALEPLRRECRAKYEEALAAYVTTYMGRPLEKLTAFFEGVSEAVAHGVPEDEVCYRAAFSKHELRRVLALYPAAEVRRALHRLYRSVDKHVSEEGGLLQVVWRAMQQELIAQHVALAARIAACYPAAGLALPLSTDDILDAFSDIAREH